MSRSRWMTIAPALSLMLLCAPVWAQDGAADCSKCVETDELRVAFHVDKTVCPGKNAIVCDEDYTKRYAKCEAGTPDIRDCKVATKKHAYPSVEYAAGKCGTASYDRNGNVTGVSGCPNPSGGPSTYTDDYEYCTGRHWLEAITLALDEGYTVNVNAPNGPTLLRGGAATLDSTNVSFPSGAVQQGLDEGLIENDGVYAYLSLTIESAQPAVSIPDQTLRLAASEGNLEIDDARIENGEVVVDVRVPIVNLGAFADYGVNLGGLALDVDSAAAQFSAVPAEPEMLKPWVLNSAEDPEPRMDLRFFVTLSSAGQELVGGSGLAGIEP